jgi:autotransporter-associated beta strand protein
MKPLFFTRTRGIFASITAFFFVGAGAHAQDSTTNTNEYFPDPYFLTFGSSGSLFEDDSSETFGTLSLGGTGGGLPLDGGIEASNQASETYTMQTGSFNAFQEEKNNNPPYAGTYNNSASELAQYANGGSFNNTPGAAAFRTFTISGVDETAAARPLQIGDTFTITGFVGSNPSAGGYIGISFRDSTTYGSFFDATDASTEARFQLDSTGNWKVYHDGGTTSSGNAANADATFTIKITSLTTFDATVGGTTYRNLFLDAGGGLIDSFAIYTYGDNNQNSFWKNASLNNTGSVELGYALDSGTFTPGLITDGLTSTSDSTTSVNNVNVGGDAGSQVNLNQNNTYTGTTTVNANATLEAQHANALGSTAAGTTVSVNGALKLFDATGISFASEALTLNGTGVGGVNGALRNEGGDNTWNGTITLGSNSRINANTAGASGSLTIEGDIDGGSNVLFIGALGSTVEGRTGGNVIINSTISGQGGAQDGTTSVWKDGVGALTLTGANDYTGATLLQGGTILVGNNSAFGEGTVQIHFASGGSDKTIASTDGTARTLANNLNVYNNFTLGATDRTGGITFQGAVELGEEAGTSNITTASGTSHTFSGVVSGLRGITKLGAGSLTLSGASANDYADATIVSAGTLILNKTAGVNAIAGNITVNTGATLLVSASNQVANTSAVTLSGGTITRGSGVSEVFGSLNLTDDSFLDFGTGTTGTLSFGSYTPSSLLTVNNFGLGNTLTFGSDLTASINNGSLFSFDNGFTSSWDGGTSTFTITAIPEPSTYLAAAGLLAMFLWPVRRRLIKDAKSVLGLRPTGRDRIEAYRQA